MSIIGLLFDEITPVLVALRATEYMFAASAALWAYDYLLTLDREIELVWKSSWSFGKVMFFLNRYSPIADLMLANVAFLKRGNQSDCHKIASALAAFTETGLIWSQTILAMRTWAIWGATRPMLIFLTIWVTANVIVSTVLAQRFFDLVQYVDVPPFLVPSLRITCAPLPGHDAIWPELLVYATNEAGIAVLALVRGFRQYRSIKNPLLSTMFHDGLLYYFYTIILVVSTIIVSVAAPLQWSIFLDLISRVLTSIFCTRILLNIRGTYFKPDSNRTTLVSDFRPRPRSGQLDGGSTTLPTIQFDERDNALDDDSEDGPAQPEGQGWTWSVPNASHD